MMIVPNITPQYNKFNTDRRVGFGNWLQRGKRAGTVVVEMTEPKKVNVAGDSSGKPGVIQGGKNIQDFVRRLSDRATDGKVLESEIIEVG